jgi:hypothetical protein
MVTQPFRAGACKPSMYYLMIAESLFRRALCVRRGVTRDALRGFGRNYLARAVNAAPAPQLRSHR